MHWVSSASFPGVESEVEQPGLKPAAVWDAGVAISCLTCCATVASVFFFKPQDCWVNFYTYTDSIGSQHSFY